MKIFTVTLIILLSLNTSVCLCQKAQKDSDYLNLYLTLANGFHSGERIIISIGRSNGDSIMIYDDTLNRIRGIDDVSHFKIPLERGKANTVCIVCPLREVTCCHSFYFHEQNTYLEIYIDNLNRFLLISSDKPSVYD